jgi:hypothetical protein
MVRLLLMVSFGFVFAGCTHSLHLAHVSDFAPTFKEYNKGELIRARAEQFAIMGFVYDTHYVNEAYRQLVEGCPKGSIQGITTQYSTNHGFFSWTNVVEMQGLCIR